MASEADALLENDRAESYIRHIAADRDQALVNKKQFEDINDFKRFLEVAYIKICVPTQLTAKKMNLQYIENAADAITKMLQKDQINLLESTGCPGATDEIPLEKMRTSVLSWVKIQPDNAD
jgi:UDP-N-acetyl-D-mannosaminuronate dehydrogenase